MSCLGDSFRVDPIEDPPRTSVGKVPDSFPEGPGFDSR